MRSIMKTGILIVAVAAVVSGGLALAFDDGQSRPAGYADRHRAILDDLVDDGTLTSRQAEDVADALDGVCGGFGPHGAGPAFHQARAEDLAEFLGMDPVEIRERLEAGDTLADLAADAGIAVEDLVAHLTAPARQHLEEAVADGIIDQATADERLAAIVDRVTALVESGRPGPGGGDRFSGPHHDGAPGPHHGGVPGPHHDGYGHHHGPGFGPFGDPGLGA